MERVSYLQGRYNRVILSIPTLVPFFGLTCTLLSLYVIFYTNYWYLPLLYLTWMFTLDKNTSETGGRRFVWLQNNIPPPDVPYHFKTSSTYQLDPSKNYLFCCFPHGTLPIGVLKVFYFNKGGIKDVFRDHTPYITTLHLNYFLPFFREIVLAFNCVSVSKKSLNYLLNDARGGNVVALFVGGVDEQAYVGKENYHIFLKNRKGFVKVALENGSPLVPVFSFGLLSAFRCPKNKVVRYFVKLIELLTGKKTEIVFGQGIFQDWFGLCPIIKPIMTIAGEPIPVVKKVNPTQEEIDKLHDEFTRSLITLFETHKREYLLNGTNVKLVIE